MKIHRFWLVVLGGAPRPPRLYDGAGADGELRARLPAGITLHYSPVEATVCLGRSGAMRASVMLPSPSAFDAEHVESDSTYIPSTGHRVLAFAIHIIKT